jgi:sugar phosphate isomerase/epimerase
MRNAFSTLADTTWSLQEFLDAAGKYGYEGIDLRGIQANLDVTRAPQFQDDQLDATLAEFRKRNLQIAALSASARCSVEPAQRHEHLDEVTRYCALAARIVLSANVGRPWIRVFGGRIPDGTSFDKALIEAADQLRRYGDLAARYGLTIVVETHDDWCASARVAALMDKADHPAAAIVWDVHHPWRTTGEPPEQTWQTMGRHVRYVHLKDAKGAPGGPQQLCLTGEGNVPVKEALAVLKSHNYDGWLTLEWEKRWHPELQAAAVALPAHIEYVRTTLSR